MEPKFERSPNARIWDHGDSTTLVGTDGVRRRYDGDSAALCRAVLATLTTPHTRDEVIATIAAQAQPAPHLATVLDALLGQLQAAGAVREVPSVNEAPRASSTVYLVVGITGAVAAAHTPVLIEVLQRRGWVVRVAATRRALRFVSVDVLAALTHAPVAVGLWGPVGHPAAHIELSTWADAVLVWPASATTIARLASGMFTDAVSATAGTARGRGIPVAIAPAMNPWMLAAPAVERNLAVLREDGFDVIHPGSGVEVADTPPRRRIVSGPPLLPEAVADILAVILSDRRTRIV